MLEDAKLDCEYHPQKRGHIIYILGYISEPFSRQPSTLFGHVYNNCIFFCRIPFAVLVFGFEAKTAFTCNKGPQP